MNSFVIHQKLPSLNEVIRTNRYNRFAGAKLKSEIENSISNDILIAIRSGDLHKATSRVHVNIAWHEATKRRDADNIQSSQKFILDALVKNGILKNDSRKYVSNVYHKIIDDEVNAVVVILEEDEDV